MQRRLRLTVSFLTLFIEINIFVKCTQSFEGVLSAYLIDFQRSKMALLFTLLSSLTTGLVTIVYFNHVVVL